MSSRELDAAGVTDPVMRADYEQCRRLNAAHGRTYYLSTLLLPAAKRPYVHALYGFARYADDLVDSLTAPDPDALLEWSGRFDDDWRRGTSDHPVTRAVLDTARRWGLPQEHFAAFLDSMRSDITVTRYATYDDLAAYMYGSAAVIGLQMVPILEPLDDAAYPCARALGEAFQLTNFIRDVGEDLDRGRVYLPQSDLAAHGVTDADLHRRVLTPAIRELLRFESARARDLYAQALPGIALLHPTSRDCIRTALALYGGILEAVERGGYQVLTTRASVPVSRRLRVAVPRLLHAQRVRRVERRWHDAGNGGEAVRPAPSGP